jgi:transcriptional regulator with XRE-family HTH domain
MNDTPSGDPPTPAEDDAPNAASSVSAAVGRAIRELRELAGLNARDLARGAGVSAAMISRIESGQVSPSLNTLERIAGMLDVPMASLFGQAGTNFSDITHVRNGEGLKARRILGEHVHEYVVLGFHRRFDLQFECHLVTVKRSAKSSPPTYTGHGCVAIYVLEGEAIYRYGDQRIRIAQGDSLCLDAEMRYGVHEVITPQVKFLAVQAERR